MCVSSREIIKQGARIVAGLQSWGCWVLELRYSERSLLNGPCVEQNRMLARVIRRSENMWRYLLAKED